MDVNETILHWNCNGLRTRLQNGELTRLARQYMPAAICLQHTNHITSKIDQYHLAAYHKPSEKELGTSIYVHRNISYNQITIKNANLQTSAIELIINNQQKISLFNMYNQPSCKYNLKTISKNIHNHKMHL